MPPSGSGYYVEKPFSAKAQEDPSSSGAGLIPRVFLSPVFFFRHDRNTPKRRSTIPKPKKTNSSALSHSLRDNNLKSALLRLSLRVKKTTHLQNFPPLFCVDGSALYSTPRGVAPPTAAAAAGEAAYDDAEEGDDGVDDGREDAADARDDGHNGVSDGTEYARNLFRKQSISPVALSLSLSLCRGYVR